MTCLVSVYTDSGYIWQCPRTNTTFGYCPVHIPKHQYVIKYTWPGDSPKVRYRTRDLVTPELCDARRYSFEEAEDILRNRSHDARVVWGIVTTKKAVG